jgi:hypothetical protein
MEQSSCKAKSHLSSQEILHFTENWKVYYHVHKIQTQTRVTFCNLLRPFYGKGLLAQIQPPGWRTTLSWLSADCIFNIFMATLHIWRPPPPSAT